MVAAGRRGPAVRLPDPHRQRLGQRPRHERRERARRLRRSAAGVRPARQLAGQGMDGARRERMVAAARLRARVARAAGLVGAVGHAGRASARARRATAGDVRARRVRARPRGRPGPPVRDGPRHLRGVSQRRAGRRRRTHSGLHRIPSAPAGAGLRHHRPAAAGVQRPRRDPVRRLVPRPGGVAACPRPVGLGSGFPGPGERRIRRRHDRCSRHRPGLAQRAVTHKRGRLDRRAVGRPPSPARGVERSPASTRPAGTRSPSPTTATRTSSPPRRRRFARWPSSRP